jgi:transcriptional regulator with XRE-family HTH domain
MITKNNKITEFLNKRDLTKDELSKLAEVSSQAIDDFESGMPLTRPALEKIAQALRASVDELCGDTFPDEEKEDDICGSMHTDDEMLPGIVGRRLRVLRRARGIKTAKLAADLLGVSNSRYVNWENGVGLIGVFHAITFCEITGADLDYIYRGRQSGLCMKLVEALNKKNN